MLRWLCAQDVDKNKASPDGMTPLFAASLRGHSDVVRHLCEQGADRDRPDKDGDTPLGMACEIGALDVARCLGEHGAASRQEATAHILTKVY